MRRSIKVIFFFCMLLSANFAIAQCGGTFGQPLINQTFGQGNNTDNWYGPLALYAPGASTFTTFVGTTNPNRTNLVANQSGLVKTPATPGNPYTNSYWLPHADHTGNENGLMLLIDGIATPTIFFEQRMDNLCPNTILRLSIWVLNTNAASVRAQNPNMVLQVVDPNNSNNLLGMQSTGDVPPDGNWHQYSLEFSNGSSSVITLQLVNSTPTNSGNDFALDDITVQACGPSITPFFNTNQSSLKMCEGQTNNFSLDATVSPEYANPVYQWQEYDGSTWVNMIGKTTKNITVDFLNRTPGNYQYRLITAINGNIDKINCRAISDPITVQVNALPIAVATNNGPVCMDSFIQLNATGGTSYSWTGPNQYTSTLQNPRIENATALNDGFYEVTVTNAAGCISSVKTKVEVLPALITNISPSASICENESIDLQASGGVTYSWLPIEGLSDPNIANPIASPEKTTTYTVSIFDGKCTAKRQVTITVLKNPVANAGNDKKLLIGQSVTLNGSTTGNYTSYLWSPSDYLDDPTKLNPIATPPNDITYTLTVNSNCNISTDQVFLKVYQKIEIPNTFSPNGDGVNDTWSIPSISAFEKPILKVVNRNGQLVYETNNNQPWDGKYNGKNLPTGVYYYSLYLNEDFKLYSGWVMITR